MSAGFLYSPNKQEVKATTACMMAERQNTGQNVDEALAAANRLRFYQLRTSLVWILAAGQSEVVNILRYNTYSNSVTSPVLNLCDSLSRRLDRPIF